MYDGVEREDNDGLRLNLYMDDSSYLQNPNRTTTNFGTAASKTIFRDKLIRNPPEAISTLNGSFLNSPMSPQNLDSGIRLATTRYR